MFVSVSINPKYVPHRPHWVTYPPRVSTPVKPLRVSPEDLGYEIDADELVRELCAPLPESLLDQPGFDIDPDDFEMLYHWFLS